jgi:hypothetical protein
LNKRNIIDLYNEYIKERRYKKMGKLIVVAVVAVVGITAAVVVKKRNS